MPKSQMIIPEQVRQSGRVAFTPIPINQYEKTIREELTCYSEKDLVNIFRDMAIIRAFENMLNEVKLRGNYQGIKYSHNGPAHLSIGQEGAAVGQAFLLGSEDHVFGSHRSHGEILAKGLSAIEKLPEDSLMPIMENYFGGECLRVVEKDATGSVRELAMDYLLYGALAEIFGRMPGFNRGMGGSMHAFFPPFGIYPNNAIVGASGTSAWVLPCTRTSTEKPASSWSTSGTRPPGVDPCGRVFAFPPWPSSKICGMSPTDAACR